MSRFVYVLFTSRLRVVYVSFTSLVRESLAVAVVTNGNLMAIFEDVGSKTIGFDSVVNSGDVLREDVAKSKVRGFIVTTGQDFSGYSNHTSRP